jgi:Flp pilus assembly protein TadD
MIALHEACALRPDAAALWTLYAVACVRARREGEALRALGQALWLRQRAHDERRAWVTRELRRALLAMVA